MKEGMDKWLNKIIHGDCLEVLKQIPNQSVDAVVTDPPYDLTTPASVRRSAFPGHYHGDGFGRGQKKEKAGKGFMGKEWDGTGIAFKVETWQEVLRVLKPGGHLLSFGGTRTYHRMACAIEDAGFEIRDCIQWLYGSGFPKSHDMGKAIDKMNGKTDAVKRDFCAYIKALRDSKGLTNKEIDKYLRLNSNGATAAHYTCVQGEQPRFPRLKLYYLLKNLLGMDDRWDETIKEAEREILKHRTMIQGGGNSLIMRLGDKREVNADITAPATPEAQQWDGWGTALKPANEPIVLARKPLSEATVAANVLKWGTGAINIDGCRIETVDNLNGGAYSKGQYDTSETVYRLGTKRIEDAYVQPIGRWPANIILDEEAAALLDRQSGVSKSTGGKGAKSGLVDNPNIYGKFSGQNKGQSAGGLGDMGGASRFFYCAKTSQKERGEGNTHPTVKPIALMEYLCRLITPPGGIILDPFGGSGTTAIAALNTGRFFIGIEKEEKYVDIARKRIEEHTAQTKMLI